ncbi:MAG: hypothetical protein RL095_56 [Verrucomicrobiota bacterium]|jgi:alpha-beta hydrolase superfamily lysophospholipase/SAM-dependent methyltransferase
MKTQTQICALRDGSQLHFFSWLPEAPPEQWVILLHRGHEHGERWAETVARLDDGRTAFFAWDARGHGRSDGARGEAESFFSYAEDLQDFFRFLKSEHGLIEERCVLIAHSVGAVTVLNWILNAAPRLQGLVLATPALDIRLYLPFALPLLKLRHKLFGSGKVTSYVGPSMLTHDPEEAARYAADPLIFRPIADNVLIDLYANAERCLADAGQIRTPTLLITAGKDFVVNNRVSRRLFERLGHPAKRHLVCPEMHHAVFHESGRAALCGEIRSFLDQVRSLPTAPALPPAHEDAFGPSLDALEQTRRPCLKTRLLRGSQKLALATLGRLSQGIAIGWKHGFDSGASLDHVYRDRAQGVTPLGRLIDRVYLNSPGWIGIRQRRLHLHQALDEALAEVRAAGLPSQLLDLACGGGYVMEALERHPELSAELRDFMPDSLAVTRRHAEAKGLLNRIQLAQGDAFAAAAPQLQPSVIVVSGLLELFPSNELARRCLASCAAFLPENGRLLVTNQPWHPQLELIAALRNHRGQPWEMRCRSQAEIRALLEEQGFVIDTIRCDKLGIFSVLHCRKAGR